MDEENLDPPICSILQLKRENENLKRLLKIIKNHVIYDEKLYKEILKAVRK